MDRHMKVYLTYAQWNELCMDTHHEFVRSAFYLALPYTFIAHRVKYNSFATERNRVIESAQELGMTPDDTVVLLKGS